MPLSPEIKDAVNHIQSHAQGMQAVITLAAYVEDVKLLEQAASEAENRKSAAYAELEKIQQDADDERGAAAKAKEDIAAAKAKAKAVIDDATTEAAGIVQKAKDDAKSVDDKARHEAAKIVAQAGAQVDDANDKLAMVKADVAAEEERLAELTAQCEAVIKKADEARSYLAKLAGG